MGQFAIQCKKCRKCAGHMEDVGKKLQKWKKNLKGVSTALHHMGGYGEIEAVLTEITEGVGREEKSAKELGKALESIAGCYEETENKLVPPKEENTIGEWIHTGLDVVGLVPGLGAIADGINVVYYLGERRGGEAALSALSFLPIIGEFSGAGKVAGKAVSHADDVGKAIKGGGKAADKVLQVVKKNAKKAGKTIKNQADTVIKYVDDVIDSGKAVDNAVDASKCVDNVIKGGLYASPNKVDNLLSGRPELIGSTRDKLLATVQDSELSKIVNELYRSGATVGDGGTAAILAEEFSRGSSTHLLKATERLKQLNKLANSGRLGISDLDVIEALIDDLESAISLYN